MALSEAPLTTITAWYQDLPKRAREGLSLENLHRLSKALNAARSEPDERVKGLVEALERIASDHIKDEPSVYARAGHFYHADCDACHRQEIARKALSSYQDKPSE